jgi:outer membrane protein assembly factor BamE (lipoprotein component of BamABCDE complex)
MTPPLRSSLCVFLLAACGGCLVVPTPEHHSDSITTRRNVQPKSGDTAVTDGVTTREQVLLLLGEPDASLYGDRRFVYCWAKVIGYWFVAAGYEGDGGEIPKGYVLEIDFDDRGVSRSHQTRSCGLSDLFHQRVLSGIPYPADRGRPHSGRDDLQVIGK